MIDTLVRFRDRLDVEPVRQSLGISGPYGIVTLHRPANVDHHDRAEAIVTALAAVADEVQLVFPLHPRGRATLTEVGLMDVANLLVTNPLGYLDFMSLVASAELAVTDSGGIQEETSILGVPCLTVRPNTERPITVTNGTNRLVEPADLAAAAREALAAPSEPADIPLWDGKAGERIAVILGGHDV